MPLTISCFLFISIISSLYFDTKLINLLYSAFCLAFFSFFNLYEYKDLLVITFMTHSKSSIKLFASDDDFFINSFTFLIIDKTFSYVVSIIDEFWLKSVSDFAIESISFSFGSFVILYLFL